MSVTAATALEIEGVSKRFGSTRALDAVSFGVERGSIHALLGGNGSGKSTLIKILAGVVPADEGSVSVGGVAHSVSSLSPHLARQVGLRFVHQDLGLFLPLTVAENICLSRGFERRALFAISWREVQRQTTNLLEQWRISARPNDPLWAVRPADRTMIAIVRALAADANPEGEPTESSEPMILVLDEPTSALPETEVERLLTWMQDLAMSGSTAIFVTHRLEEALAVAKTVTVLRDGRHETTEPSAGLTRAHLVSLIAPKTTADAPRGLQGRRSAAGAPPRPPSAEPRLTVRGLAGGSLRGVDFEVMAGEVVGVAGLLGSGRTRLLQYLAGVIKPDHGTVALEGKPLTYRSEADAIRAGVVLVPEDRTENGIFPGLSISENLQAGTLATRRAAGLALTPHLRTAARRSVAKFGIKAATVDDDILTLSGGNQQKVLVGRWLATAPRVLLLDDPTVGVDVEARASLHGLVRDATSRGAAVICVSSDLCELVELCDRVLVLHEGRIDQTLAGDRLTTSALGHAIHGSVERG